MFRSKGSVKEMVRVGETAELTVVLLLVSSATGGQSYPGGA